MKGTESMEYPALIIHLEKLEQNTRAVAEICDRHGIALTAVTKCLCGMPQAAEAMLRGGATMLADSRIRNLQKLQHIAVPKMLIRIPMPSQARQVVQYADYSMNSQLCTVEALSVEAVRQGRTHCVILMIDVGDLREGCLPQDALELAERICRLPGIRLEGLGANFGCFGGVMPEYENLHILVDTARNIEEKLGIKISLLSGGNSFTYTTMVQDQCPPEINHFRLGDILLTGYDTRLSQMVPGACPDAFTLRCEVVESLPKPSQPFGKIGKDAFGNVPHFEDRGIRQRVIFAVGRQDIRLEEIFPREEGMEILGASSDHMIVDTECCERSFQPGDTADFQLTYGGILAACTSEYVEKIIVE